MLIKLLPFIALLVWAWLTMRFSLWRMKRDSRPLDDPALSALLRRFHILMQHGEYKVAIHKNPAINGLAMPDGSIYLTEGMIAGHARGDFSTEEVAGVIAHEIGHVALGHTDRRRKAWQIEMAIRAMLSAVLPRALSGLTLRIANFATRLFHAGLSQRDEYEADAFGAALMQKAGLSPVAQATMLEKLEAKGGGSGAPVSWLASHPPTPKRAEKLRAMAVARLP